MKGIVSPVVAHKRRPEGCDVMPFVVRSMLKIIRITSNFEKEKNELFGFAKIKINSLHVPRQALQYRTLDSKTIELRTQRQLLEKSSPLCCFPFRIEMFHVFTVSSVLPLWVCLAIGSIQISIS